MKILLDECITKKVIPLLAGHNVKTVKQIGCTGFKNGQLLKKASEEKFDIFLTIDKNIYHQQNISIFSIAVVILNSNDSNIESLKDYVTLFVKKIKNFRKGERYIIDID
jgi:hypothetical protein